MRRSAIISSSITVPEAFMPLAAYGKYGGRIKGDEGLLNYVKLELKFPSSMPDLASKPDHGTIIVETAPSRDMPYAVYKFLNVVSKWGGEGGGAFHRNAGHVLQVMVR